MATLAFGFFKGLFQQGDFTGGKQFTSLRGRFMLSTLYLCYQGKMIMWQIGQYNRHIHLTQPPAQINPSAPFPQKGMPREVSSLASAAPAWSRPLSHALAKGEASPTKGSFTQFGEGGSSLVWESSLLPFIFSFLSCLTMSLSGGMSLNRSISLSTQAAPGNFFSIRSAILTLLYSSCMFVVSPKSWASRDLTMLNW